ncbi:MAG: hypothetical protein PWR31_1495 [Bacillota bacterium]|nr:hypothetical protein [Bacillota bacterium]
MNSALSLPYGRGTLHCPKPPGFLGEFRLPPAEPLTTQELKERLTAALAQPQGGPPLAKLAAAAKSALLVCDDHTRPTPVADLLGPLLAVLTQAGIAPADIAFLVATGSHREPTAAEAQAKLGRCARDLPVLIHREAETVPAGRTESGVPIHLNHHLARYDLIIGLGSILPHRYAGWSGGAKIICPGVTGRATNAAVHLLILADEHAALGQSENRVRYAMEAIARRARLSFIVNAILTPEGRIADVVAGDPVAAHRLGAKRAEAAYAVPVPQADVVLVSSYPEDANLWQAAKACYAAAAAVRPGGSIILVTPAPEGLGEHLDFFRLSCQVPAEIRAAVARGAVADGLGAAAAYALAQVRSRARLYLVSEGILPGEAEAAGCTWAATPETALRLGLAQAGPDATWLYLREGSIILPRPA